MQNVYILLGIYAVGVLLLSLVLLFLPLHTIGVMTKPFSFKTFGIRKVKRWNSRTDTLGNLFSWISLFLCLLYPFLPFSMIIYVVFLTFSWLACVSRAVRLTHVHSVDRKLILIFLINMTFGFGLLAGTGVLNDFRLWTAGTAWFAALIDGSGRHILWYLNEPYWFAYLMQVILMFIPLLIFWGQFKYMRLENTFKASNIVFYVIKMIVWNAVIIGLGMFGYPFLNQAYNREADVKIAVSLDNLPSLTSDLLPAAQEALSSQNDE